MSETRQVLFFVLKFLEKKEIYKVSSWFGYMFFLLGVLHHFYLYAFFQDTIFEMPVCCRSFFSAEPKGVNYKLSL